MIFVFGSNEAGIHGAGAAKTARQRFGAIYGQGVGLQGNSYGIPTKNTELEVLSLVDIRFYVSRFMDFAQKNPDKTFYVTRIGTGLSGLADEDIAPMFKYSPANCIFDIVWKPFLGNARYFTEYI